MRQSSPKPLPRHRLEKIVSGLRTRYSSSAQTTAEEIEHQQQTLASFQERTQAELTALETRTHDHRDRSTTQWDEEIHAGWDAAELRAYRAVHDTARKETALRKTADTQTADTKAEAKSRKVDIEQRFQKAREAPLTRFKNLQTAIAHRLHELSEIEREAENALAQRSIRLPDITLDPLPQPEITSSKVGFDLLTDAVTEARQYCNRIASHPLSKFVESGWWLLICALLFLVVTGGLMGSGLLLLVPAVLAGAGTAIFFVVGGFMGVRPLLKRNAAAEYPKVMRLTKLSEFLAAETERHAAHERDKEIDRLTTKRDEQFAQVRLWRQQNILQLQDKLTRELEKLKQFANQEKQAASTQLVTSETEADVKYRELQAQEALAARQEEAEIRQTAAQQHAEISQRINQLQRGGAMRLQTATEKAVKFVSLSKQWASEHFPTWNTLAEDLEHWPAPLSVPQLPLGILEIQQVMPDGVGSILQQAHPTAPVLFSPLDDGFLVIHGAPTEPAVRQLVRSLVLRTLTSLPPGNVNLTVIDPPGLGQDFGWLMHLGDFDPQLVSHRVWTQPSHISQQIATLSLAAEDIIQQSLRNQYANIAEYNADAGALAEPYRMLVWSSLPAGLEDNSWKNLQSIIDTGARCGIIPILIVDPNSTWSTPDQRDFLMRRGLHLQYDPERKAFSVKGDSNLALPLQIPTTATEEETQKIIGEVGRRALVSSRVEVPLDRMVPAHDAWWQGDSSHSLEIPIGQSGVGRTHSLKLGIGTAQHAIIAGKTGSGKSSLLHAMITSAILKYSPERLRLVLLDFKKGVEFQVYAEAAIAHADIIGIESHREFGLSSLEYIDDCMQRRGEAFRKVGAQDVASWNALHPDHPMPRMLLVIDEFQELFVEDDKLSSQASLILDRIVRQGRSFGVHAVLSSQTLAGSYSLPRTTLGQMAVRIALQCDPSDAQIIFADDNPAASRLKTPGQAVYNDAGGRVEGNQPMQIGWMPKQKQVEWFHQLDRGYRNGDFSTNRLGRTVIYDGNRAATWDDNNAELAITQSIESVNPDATWCIVGESVAIHPAVTFPLTRQAGRNVLIVGGDDSQAAAVLDVLTSSFVRGARRASPNTPAQVYVVQGAKPTDAKALTLPKKWQALDCELRVVDTRGVDELLKELHAELQSRIASGTSEGDEPADAPSILVELIQIGRLRTLKRDDDFGMGGFGESELTPEKHLEELLRDGPSHGMHLVLWAESQSTAARWVSRASMREIEIRLLMQMSANDSTNLVDSVAASKLGEHVMLLYDEATGQEERFRPFATESLVDLVKWSASLDE
ncbi:FtsK/SpoIIIE domain-containing protein [Aureliella helgolandensis]|uniref:FtsK-like domain-containing protein n=1 Tax=Aureliella helgolandensis TaxID=2527968 RepID=A0A518G6S5_9BACT|nr:FtsK/SpoIIIE domain-containing protein [Aureliella helgolandensis]QDV24290.1 FtsK-like domain-containing protein [Aureliella helgolandensis]